MVRSWIASRAALALLLCFAACEAGTVTDSSEENALPSGPNPPGGGGTIQRASLNVRVFVDPDDAAIATVAGVTAAGLTVRLTRNGSSEPPRSAVTGENGSARFEGLLQGTYLVSVDRVLTPAELAQLPPEDREASMFAGGASILVAPPAGDVEVGLVAARRGSLIVSEVFIYTELVPGAGNDGHYIEVYNNADTTIFLDRLLLFRTDGRLHHPSFCDQLSEKRLDPTGIWVHTIHQFPGGGQSYPIRAGEAKVVAIDAIDHRPIGDGMQDLSRAEFEIIGNSADPNNSFAGDMIRLKGLVSGTGHGEPLSSGILVGVALPIAQDTTELERGTLTITGSFGEVAFSAFKIPREAVLDAAGVKSTRESEILFRNGNSSTCTPFASSVFERAPAPLVDHNVPMAISRKSLGRTTSGAEILQRTRTSERDFEYASPLRRSLQRPPR